MKFPIYVINLARAVERRESIVALLDAEVAGGYEVVEAVDGRAVDVTNCTPPVRQDIGDMLYAHTLTAGEIGCCLSHYHLWSRMVREQTPFALILEDDARWDGDLWEIAAELVACEWEWDAVLLHEAKRGRDKKRICKLGGGRELVRHHRLGTCSTAYMVSLRGAEKLRRQFSEIVGPLDLVWRDHWHTDMVFYEVMPGPATVSGDGSTIGGRRTARTFAQTLVRKVQKFYLYRQRRRYHRTHLPRRRG